MLEGVLQTADGAVDTAHQLLALFARDDTRIHETGRAAGSAQRAFAILRRRPLVTIDGVAKGAGMTSPTAARAIDMLTGLHIARELTGKRRNRRARAEPILLGARRELVARTHARLLVFVLMRSLMAAIAVGPSTTSPRCACSQPRSTCSRPYVA